MIHHLFTIVDKMLQLPAYEDVADRSLSPPPYNLLQSVTTLPEQCIDIDPPDDALLLTCTDSELHRCSARVECSLAGHANDCHCVLGENSDSCITVPDEQSIYHTTNTENLVCFGDNTSRGLSTTEPLTNEYPEYNDRYVLYYTVL